MARKLRVQYPEAIYHVMNRGDRREPIFADDFAGRLNMGAVGYGARCLRQAKTLARVPSKEALFL